MNKKNKEKIMDILIGCIVFLFFVSLFPTIVVLGTVFMGTTILLNDSMMREAYTPSTYTGMLHNFNSILLGSIIVGVILVSWWLFGGELCELFWKIWNWLK